MRLITIFAALLAATLPALARDNEKLMEAYFSVVMIRGYHNNGGLAYGSGVVVGDNKVITNCHVLRTSRQPWISRGEDTYSIISVKADAWHDLCLVSSSGLPFKPVRIGSSIDLKFGQQVVAFGHSNGVPAPLTSVGNVEGLFLSEHGKVIRSSAKFLIGASGSGLFDEEGRLVGINTFKTSGKGGGAHYALPIEWLETLEKQPEQTTFPIVGKALWEEDEDKKPYYMQAAVPEVRQDWPKLAQIALSWTKAEPGSTEAFYALGLAYENLAKADMAAQAYSQAVALESNNFEAWVRIGVLAKNRGDNAEMHRAQVALNNIDKNLGDEYSRMLECNATC
ncbi:MAG TPA: trypsin-like peptidase domain-containing protein [Methylophilus sp.]|nr:trypsin-like peptidase domain-containing protein [Methylophilus sp.]HQQ33990.1 trypsin-like peptidase domain-containing protein [Methylophilus sp.]